jgi:hypothetical protein
MSFEFGQFVFWDSAGLFITNDLEAAKATLLP